MCLMQTDLPVPDGPRIIEILPSGMPMLSPRRILLRPNALCTSTNSTASGTPVGRWAPVCHWYSSSGLPCPLDASSRRLYSGSSSGRRPTSSVTSACVGCSDCTFCVRSSGCPCGGCCRGNWVSSLISASDWCAWVGAPEQLGAEHSDEVDQHDVEHHRLRGRGSDPDRAAARVVAVVAPDEHDDRGHAHALDHAV